MNHARILLPSTLCAALLATATGAEQSNPVADATNALGLDLYRHLAAEPGNLCLSPYSIQAAFAMTTNGAISESTRLVLVNALYFKAAWQDQFRKSATRPAAFHLATGDKADVPTMHATGRFGHSKEDGYTALVLPYSKGFSMLLIVPDEIGGLPAIERGLTSDKLSSLARLPSRGVSLHFPKFKIEGPTVRLGGPLGKLGMKLAFDQNLADFGPMTSDKTLPSLYISDAYHKTFIAVDEDGTEAAAATAVVAADPGGGPARPEDPLVVKVDRPFFYAIMDGRSRTALFIGRVMDPR